MQQRKFRILSATTVGSLALAVMAITASSSTSQTATHTALAAQTGSFPPVNLDDCPILHTGYPQGGCVAQMQTDLRIVQDSNLDVDGLFGSVHSQTYNAVIAFQTAQGLNPDGMVGPATKNALATALSGSSVPTPHPGAPLTPFEICQAQGPGLISDGHGGCTHDGVVALGKSPSECLEEATTDKVNELIAQGYTAEAAETAARIAAEKVLEIYAAGTAFKCALLDNPDS
jgi:predicted RNase H-like HicB family nuclease